MGMAVTSKGKDDVRTLWAISSLKTGLKFTPASPVPADAQYIFLKLNWTEINPYPTTGFRFQGQNSLNQSKSRKFSGLSFQRCCIKSVCWAVNGQAFSCLSLTISVKYRDVKLAFSFLAFSFYTSSLEKGLVGGSGSVPELCLGS